MRSWGEMSWPAVQDEAPGAIVLLPVGAIEAHGPHLPLDTDVLIGRAMAAAGAGLLEEAGERCLLLPVLPYSPAPFAAAHAGTLGLGRDTMAAVLGEVGGGVLDLGPRALVLVSAHLDPANRACCKAAAAELAGRGTVVFPNLARPAYAERLGEAFLSGDHAGAFETSLILAIAPDRVDAALASGLAANDASLTRAIGEGAATFAEAGGPDAYFGDPAAATADQGRALLSTLGAILRDAVAEALRPQPS